MRATFGLLVIALFCTHTQAAEKKDAKQSSWQSMMQSFIAPVANFYSLDLEKNSYTRGEKRKLKKIAKELNKNSQKAKFSKMSHFSKKDPAVKERFDDFLRTLKSAENSMSDSPKQGIHLLRQSIMQCASCHSMGGKSTGFFKALNTDKIPLYDKGHFALALRDYKASSEIYKKIVLNSSANKSSYLLEDQIRYYLSASLLADTPKKEVVNTLKKIKKPVKEKNFLHLSQKISDIEGFTPIKSFEDAKKRLSLLSSQYRAPETKTYSFVALKNYFHTQLPKIEDKKKKAQTYKALGDLYKDFNDISVYMAPKKNYEMCIKTLPHTRLAKNCFDSYVTNVVLGYSGSRGVKIPKYEMKKVEKLKKLL